MGTSGDKIVLLDGMGSGSGSAANGLLSMIPGMFANLIGGNKMDPNLVAALMNSRNNQDGFGGANGWWLWIIVLFWLWGVLDCDQKIVKAVLAYLEDPDAPEGTAFVRYLAVLCFVGDTIKWSDMI